MPLFTRPNSWLKHEKPVPVKSFPLDIPELLEVIFSYLSRHVLQKYISLVCRQWYNIVKKVLLLTQAITWTADGRQTEGEMKQLTHDLQQVRVLKLMSRSYSYQAIYTKWFKNFYDICTSLNSLAMDGQLKLTFLNINLPMESDLHLLPLLDITGSFLTRLELTKLEYFEVPLKGILARCPKLLDLKIEGCSDSSHDYETLDSRDIPDQLVLRSLILHSVSINSSVLMQLLISSPNMEELQLIKLIIDDFTTQGGNTNNRFRSIFEESILKNIALQCPKLQKVHLSNSPDTSISTLSYETMSQLLGIFPNVVNWGFLSTDLSSTRRFQAINNRTNTITSLEIVDRMSFVNDTTNYLHEFLCESPQLIHLKASDVTFPIILFDLEGSIDWTKWNYKLQHEFHSKYDKHTLRLMVRTISPYHRKIWACRNLKTLRLTFLRFNCDHSTAAAATRLLFGYISKVCPRLQELVIAQDNVDLSRKGGLCLLTRLHSLKSLRILSQWDKRKHYPSEVEWIFRNMSQSLKIKLNLLVSTYKFMEPKILFATSPFQCTTNAYHPFCPKVLEDTTADSWMDDTWEGDHIIDGVDMRYLGRLKDVTMCFQDRLSNNMPCWPHLESITLVDRGYFRSGMGKIAKSIASHRPDTLVN